MSSVHIKLKKVSKHEWQLFAPKGYPIGFKFRGDKYKALDWAKAYISTWPDWVIIIEEGEDSEKKD